ncbi:MAG: hypothetical protein KDI79_14010 [Anaerolineae bacterium]|nr:hypothetical protein [Anaerolineae bacterium]
MQNDFDATTEDSLPVPKPSLPSEPEPSPSTTAAKIFQGNSYDLVAFIGVVVGGMTLLSCATLGVGQYCMPLVPIILGIVGLVSAKDSLNPERTRQLSWLSIGAGGVILLLLLIFVGFYIALVVFGVAAENGF